MWKKLILMCALGITVQATIAQIGYKGQVTISTAAGINQLGGASAELQVGAYVSAHSILSMGAMWDGTRYNAGYQESFRVTQWLGSIRYQYAVPLGRFMLIPTGGFLMGAENSDPMTNLGNLVRYKGQFVYGVSLELGVEYVFVRHWALTLSPRLSYLINTNFDKVKLSGNLGLKYYF